MDSNGRLSQDELNFYTFLTSNELLSDDDWRFVGGKCSIYIIKLDLNDYVNLNNFSNRIETVGLEKNELTKDGFIQLYKIEAKRDDTDIEDINVRLANMGFNKALTIDQVIFAIFDSL